MQILKKLIKATGQARIITLYITKHVKPIIFT